MQDLLVSVFGDAGATPARVVIALVLVLVLIYAAVWVFRRYLGGAVAGQNRGRQPRLAVMDVAAVDARRRLILVRRDNVEHLILVGGPTDVVVEQTIVRGVPVGTMGKMPQRSAPAPEAHYAPGPVQRDVAPPSPAHREAAAAQSSPAAESQPDMSALAASVAAGTVAAAATTLRAPMPVQHPASPMIETGPALATPPPSEPARPLPRATPQPSPRPALRPSREEAAAPVAPPVVAVTAGPPVADMPYVPPEATRPERAAEPVATAPIVPPTAAVPAGAVPGAAVAGAGVASPPAQPPPAAQEDIEDLDDLARRLDEALRLDLGDRAAGRAQASARSQPPAPARPDPAPAPYLRPTRGPAAKADIPTAPPVVQAAPATETGPDDQSARIQDQARSVLGAAGSWFRPRTARQEEERAAAASPTAPAAPPAAAVAPAPEPDIAPTIATPEADVAAVTPPAAEERSRRMAEDFERMLSDTAKGDGVDAQVGPDQNEGAATVARDAPEPADEASPEEPPARVAAPEPVVEIVPADLEETPPVTAPVPAVEPPTAEDSAAGTQGADGAKGSGRDPDFSSLEDEMARLLDELAGDSRPRP